VDTAFARVQNVRMDVGIAKPRLRGVFHLWAFFAAVVAGVMLVALAEGLRERFASWVYALALAAMFGASAVYHRVDWRSPARRAWARRLDHSTIFIFIAGTYTPFALLAFEGFSATVVLATVWAGAALGLAINLCWIDAPQWVAALSYLAVGWVGVIAVPQLFSKLGVAAAVLVVVGGFLYTLGAVVYSIRRPDPFPATFGYHEVFHVLVVAAAVAQFVAVSLVVL
jgi:hemolysin III